ncbi:MAG: hypothetical protein ACREEM_31795 [Blastocatellia bacterium]
MAYGSYLPDPRSLKKKLSHGLQFFTAISAWSSEAQKRVCAFGKQLASAIALGVSRFILTAGSRINQQ